MFARPLDQDSTFARVTLSALKGQSKVEIDRLPFGVVGLCPGGSVEIYNATEAKMAGISEESVLGTNFFSQTAQCMNNYLVAQRLEDEPELDVVLDYVLTLRMRPTPVRLRLLKSASVARRYVLIQR